MAYRTLTLLLRPSVIYFLGRAFACLIFSPVEVDIKLPSVIFLVYLVLFTIQPP